VLFKRSFPIRTQEKKAPKKPEITPRMRFFELFGTSVRGFDPPAYRLGDPPMNMLLKSVESL